MDEPQHERLVRLGLGLRLRELRVGAGKSLAETAERAGLSVSYLSDMERGRRLPSLTVLDQLGKALQVLPVDILRDLYPWGTTTPPSDLSPPQDGRFKDQRRGD